MPTQRFPQFVIKVINGSPGSPDAQIFLQALLQMLLGQLSWESHCDAERSIDSWATENLGQKQGVDLLLYFFLVSLNANDTESGSEQIPLPWLGG